MILGVWGAEQGMFFLKSMQNVFAVVCGCYFILHFVRLSRGSFS